MGFRMRALFRGTCSVAGAPRVDFRGLDNTKGTLSKITFSCMFLSARLRIRGRTRIVNRFLREHMGFVISTLNSVGPSRFGGTSRAVSVNARIIPCHLSGLRSGIGMTMGTISNNM